MRKPLTITSALLSLFISSAIQAAELTVTEKIEIAAPPSLVWENSKNFDDIASWHPAVISQTTTNANQPGSVRIANLGGPTITEELVRFNEEHRNFTYRIKQVDPAILPVENYIAWYAVRDNDQGGSSLIWMGSFSTVGDANPEEVKKSVRGIYRAGLENLKTMLETPAK
ncbi:MAG: SRPBCC family protein [Cycloclasticus sp.]